jgi:hypothetical protein
MRAEGDFIQQSANTWSGVISWRSDFPALQQTVHGQRKRPSWSPHIKPARYR